VAEHDTDRDQRTEEATPRRREEARERGQVAISSELIAALMLSAGVGSMLLVGGAFADSTGGVIARSIELMGDRGTMELSPRIAAGILDSTLRAIGPGLAGIVIPVVIVGALVGYGQVGFRVAPKAVAMDASKLDPLKGLRRIFGARGVVRTIMAALKIFTIAGTMSVIAWLQVPQIIRLGPTDLGPLLRGLGHVALRCTAGALIAILLLSLVDLLFQRWQQERDLRMTRQEVKEEHKNTEGDPHVKGRIRSVQREMARRRMMAEVPKATVVVTNPTHYAVALRYERDGAGNPISTAPVCVAKGVDSVAQRIKSIAREHGVVCYEDRPLARSLYAQVEVGEEIPEDLYAAVAAVLTYVYRLDEAPVPA
jgi:flagellar biosynthetic protein FlhB